MNSFLTYLVRGNPSLQLAAHLAAGILSLLLLAGAACPESSSASSPALTQTQLVTPALMVATTPTGR
jgi:hypothetical protein